MTKDPSTNMIIAGDYRDDIQTELAANGQSGDDTHIQQSLFNCLSNGQIDFVNFCGGGCVGGDSRDDYCS